MKKTLIYRGIAATVAGVLMTAAAVAQDTAAGIAVEHPTMTRNANLMTVAMDLDLSELELYGNSAAVFTPTIVNGTREQALPAVGVYGRTRWYQYVRSGSTASGADERTIRYSKRPDKLIYSETIPFADWMDGAHLELRRSDYSCCNTVIASNTGEGAQTYGVNDALQLASYRNAAYTPTFHYVQPKAEAAKLRELTSTAFVDYPVDRTDIRPEFRNNRTELGKITALIDSLRNDRDITVVSLSIKGFASPEDTYERNERLARERTAALKKYVSERYHFGEGFITTDYVPEDWTGLREQVVASKLPHRAEVLAIIDDMTLALDAKDWRLKMRYPEDYKVMLEEFYPALRRSDFRIEYTVRGYENVEQIRKIMATSPQKLSLNEMYLLAQSCDPESEEYCEVFETAARLYPGNETANLNAANAAMRRGNLSGAERYLTKAGQSADATYARGLLAGLQGDYARAEQLIREAGAQGVQGTAQALKELETAKHYNK